MTRCCGTALDLQGVSHAIRHDDTRAFFELMESATRRQFFGLGIGLLLVGALCSTAAAQFVPGINGMNGLFSVPSTTLGEAGRLTITGGGVYSTRQDSGGIVSVAVAMNPFRNIGIFGGIAFDSRPGMAALRQQTHLGIRAILNTWTTQQWWNAGFEATVLQDRMLDSAGVPHFFGSARAIASVSPFLWTTFSGYAGIATNNAMLSGLATQARTLVRGGGISLKPVAFASIIAEFSNGFFPMDPTMNVGMGGLRLIVSPELSVTAGYGRMWRNAGASQPVIVGSIAFSSGDMQLPAFQRMEDFVQAPVMSAASAAGPNVNAALDTSIAIPVTIAKFSLPVQSDPGIAHVLALAQPRQFARVFDVIDSTRLREEILGLNGDSTRVLQVTATESASSEGDTARIAARVAFVALARNAGMSVSRLVLRDQYTPRRDADPIAFGFFEAALRQGQFDEVARVEAMRLNEALDSLSAILSVPSQAQRARILVLSMAFDEPVLRAAYALQDMMYAQSLFPSYSIDIVFRKVDFGDPLIIVQTAP